MTGNTRALTDKTQYTEDEKHHALFAGDGQKADNDGDGEIASDVERANPAPTLAAPNDETGVQPVERTATASSKKPYSSFNQREKILIVLCATMGGLFSPFTTNIYYPALNTIASALHVSISKVNLSITTYMILQAIAPTFISAFTDSQGRRPTYVIGFIIYMASNIGLGLNNTYAGLLVLRCIQSAGSSGLTTIQQAIIADVVTSAERGSYIAITSISSVVAPSVAPIVGGVLAQHLGWHSIFWFLLIMAGVYLVPLMLFMPETSRKLVDDGSILPPRSNMSLLNVWQSHHRRRSGKVNAQESQPRAQRRNFEWPNPMPVLRVFMERESLILLFVSSVCYAAFYAISASITTQFAEIYHLDSTLQGLLFIPQAVGSILSAITNSTLLDRNYRRHAKKMGVDPDRKKQINLIGFPIERVRLEFALPLFTANSCFMIIYGWLLESRIRIEGPIVMLVLIGYTTLAGFSSLIVLLIDINRHRAASAAAASNLSRCLLGAAMTAVINPLIESIGRGWTFTFTGLLQLVCLPGFWLCMVKGMKWRGQQAEKTERAKKDKEEREREKVNMAAEQQGVKEPTKVKESREEKTLE